MTDALLFWTVNKLKHEFGLDASDDIVQYILSIDNADEIVEYVGDLLQGTQGNKKEFVDELVLRWQSCQSLAPYEHGPVPKKELVMEGLETVPKDTQKKSKRKGRNKQAIVLSSQPESETVKTPIDLIRAQQRSSEKKKNKFVNLYAKEGGDKLAVLLPGRQPCECLAQKHRLINNCLSCGRIVCSAEEQEILQRDSNKSQKLRKKLMGEGTDREYLPHQEAVVRAGLEKAVKHKEKLLEFDKNSVKRTQVLDDESDYFASDSNQWISPVEREALRKREEELRELRHASRKDRKLTLDFAGRRVLDEGENLTPYYQKFDETVKAINSGSFGKTPNLSVSADRQHLRELVNPNILQAAPEWVDVSCGDASRKTSSESENNKQKSERCRLRLQDKELQEISDGGWCLSMHQPWASLLVKGIKRSSSKNRTSGALKGGSNPFMPMSPH
ncbi:hypothetical protein DNTS_017736 [Danionella cerebrum]|uniref:Uncharacterized protein n=1 Tax=Danionella cerebrum TaxID=2873325 RepID=A0A553RQ14_9TELE|nr:hypothetical protein DNTS_017736 [Danionella translucida]